MSVGKCSEHDWEWSAEDDEYGCPVCFGRSEALRVLYEKLDAEKARTKLGFIQYQRIEELVGKEVRSDAD